MKNTIKKGTTKPLFTGDYKRDTVVSEYEKVAEASNFLFEKIKCAFGKLHNKKNLTKK